MDRKHAAIIAASTATLIIVLAGFMLGFQTASSTAKSLQVKGVELRTISLGQGAKNAALTADLLLDNPLPVQVTLNGVKYSIYVDDVPVGEGMLREATLNPASRNRVTLTVTTNDEVAVSTLTNAVSKGYMVLRVEASYELPVSWFGLINIPDKVEFFVNYSRPVHVNVATQPASTG